MGGGTELEHIDAVDAFARTLFVRVQNYQPPRFTEVAAVVQRLHLALRHLRVEAADPDSLLRSPDAFVYARQLRPMVEDCDFALKQLQTILEKFDCAGGRETDGLADRIAAVRSRLANETTSVDMFLDTVQLSNPANNAPELVPQGSKSNLENIKDKVDNIAARLFHRWSINGGIMNDEDSMWQEFKSELEMEGFSPQILHKHKEVLRAYIRGLQAMSATNGGRPPTVRGLLEQEAAKIPPPLPPKEPLYLKELYPSYVENEKCVPSIKKERRMPDDAPVTGAPCNENRSFSSNDGADAVAGALALISTKDLMNMDSISADMAVMRLKPSSSYLATPGVRSSPALTPPGMSGSWPPPHTMSTGQFNLPESVGESPHMNYLQPGCPSTSGAESGIFSSSPEIGSRLAPDRYGKEIPMDAAWTKIRRSLVSPEVLQRAGVRYEARPEYVAILGRLSREQIEDYARQSADCRAARSGRYLPAQPQERYPQRYRADSKSSREDDDGSILWDESDATDHDDDKTSTRGAKTYPYIVSPPIKDKTSPSSTVKPKPILKNKNENHVRFDPEPHEVDIKSSKSYDGYSRRRENDSRRNRDHRDNGKREERPRGDDNRHRYLHRSEHGRRRDRRDERHMRRKTWGETIGVVSIGGAAASLLGVLTEAAVGF